MANNIDFTGLATKEATGYNRKLPGIDEQTFAQPATSASPYQQFNLKLMDMLKQYQGVNTADLMKRKNALLKAKSNKISEITPDELRTLSPAQQDLIRQASASALSPEIEKLNLDIGTRQEQTQSFGNIFSQAMQIGRDIAKLEEPKLQVMGNSLLSIDKNNKVTILHTEGTEPEYKVINDSLVRINPDNTIDVIEVPKSLGEEKMDITFKDDGQGNIYKIVSDPFSGETVRMEKIEGVGKAPSVSPGEYYEQLSPNMKIQAIDLTTKLTKGKGTTEDKQAIRNTIAEMMVQGQSLDDIEDTLRYSWQSEELGGYWRSAVENISPLKDNQSMLDALDRRVQSGDIPGAKEYLKRAARASAGTTQEKLIMGKEITIDLMDRIKEDLLKLKEKKIDTNIFSGTAEKIAEKIGKITSPELAIIMARIEPIINDYRLNMTGVAFSVEEAELYKNMFPGIDKEENFNLAKIEGLTDTFKQQVEGFYKSTMGELPYNSLFKEGGDLFGGSAGRDEGFPDFDFDIDITKFGQ